MKPLILALWILCASVWAFLGGMIVEEATTEPKMVTDTLKVYFNAPDSLWAPHLEVECLLVNWGGYEEFGEKYTPTIEGEFLP